MLIKVIIDEGETVEEALYNLREATELDLEEFPLDISGRSLLTTFGFIIDEDLTF